MQFFVPGKSGNQKICSGKPSYILKIIAVESDYKVKVFVNRSLTVCLPFVKRSLNLECSLIPFKFIELLIYN